MREERVIPDSLLHCHSVLLVYTHKLRLDKAMFLHKMANYINRDKVLALLVLAATVLYIWY